METRLTTQQIQFIENALIEKCNFKDFDDVRLEVVDHIATEIEDELNHSEGTFHQAFVKVMNKWNPIILPKTWSRYENVPYIVCKLWKSLDWKFQFSAIPIVAVISFVAYQLQEKDISMYFFMLPILLLGFLANAYLVYRKFTNKTHSTLSTYALQKIMGQTFLLVAFLLMNLYFVSSVGSKTIIPVFWPTTYVSLLAIGKAWVMHKHLKIENQLLKVI